MIILFNGYQKKIFVEQVKEYSKGFKLQTASLLKL